MGQTITVLGIAALVLLAGTAVASTAFTTATIDRDANVDVETDDNGIIGLEANNSVGGIGTNSDELYLNLNQGTGLNIEGQFEFGDNASAPTYEAFNVTNNDGATHDVELDYGGVTSDGSGDANVKFEVYDAGGTLLTTVSEESGSQTITLSSGESVAVVIIVSTSGQTSGDDLSGTLTITAN